MTQREPEPELEQPPQGAAGIASLFSGFPSKVTNDPRMGGCRGVVATRNIAAGERVLVSAPMAVSIDWRHKATGCAHCFATRELDDPEGDEWELRCEDCHSCCYCSELCMAAAAPAHSLECAGENTPLLTAT